MSTTPRKRVAAARRLTKEQHQEIFARLQAGESGSALAREFKVSRQAIHFLKCTLEFRAGLTDKPPRRQTELKMKLMPDQWAALARIVRESRPIDHDLHQLGDAPQSWWTLERGLELARRLFHRTPAKYRMKELLDTHATRPKRADDPDEIPPPPVRHTLETLTASERADPELAAYLVSETYWRIQQREYEIMLRECYGMEPGATPASPPARSNADVAALPPPSGAMPSFGRRVGKHRQGRQPAVPKRKLKRKRRC
jgi:hypothetical protein